MALSFFPFSYFQIFLPQSPLVMPKVRRQLSKEELEIQEVLSPTQGSSRQSSGGSGIVIRTSTGTPASVQVHEPAASRVPVERPPVQPVLKNIQLPRLSLSDLASIIKDSVVTGIKEGFPVCRPGTAGSLKRKRPVAHIPSRQYDDDNDDIDEDLPDVGVDAVLGDTASRGEIFGVDVNESEYEDFSDEDDPDHSYVPEKVNCSRNPPPDDVGTAEEPISSVSTPSPSADEPDPDLPSVNSRLPANWVPSEKIMSFVKKVSDIEWTKESRQKILDKFHPAEEYDQYLLPVKMPTKLYKSLKSPAAKKKDYLFSRLEVERQLFNANYDLCTALRPLIEAYSAVSSLPDSGCHVLQVCANYSTQHCATSTPFDQV